MLHGVSQKCQKPLDVTFIEVKTRERPDTSFVKSGNRRKTRRGIWVKVVTTLSSEIGVPSLGAIPKDLTEVFRFLRFLAVLPDDRRLLITHGAREGVQAENWSQGGPGRFLEGGWTSFSAYFGKRPRHKEN